MGPPLSVVHTGCIICSATREIMEYAVSELTWPSKVVFHDHARSNFPVRLDLDHAELSEGAEAAV